MLVALVSGAWLLIRLSDIVASFLIPPAQPPDAGGKSHFRWSAGAALQDPHRHHPHHRPAHPGWGKCLGADCRTRNRRHSPGPGRAEDPCRSLRWYLRRHARCRSCRRLLYRSGRQGTVEEIGISSLRLRTQDRSVISIPNAKVAEMELENFSLRDQFWLHQVFTLRFDTPTRQCRASSRRSLTCSRPTGHRSRHLRERG